MRVLFLYFRGTYVLKDKRLRPSEFAKAIRTIRLIKGRNRGCRVNLP